MAGSKELNKYLKQLTKEELIVEVVKLHSRFKFVKEYYASEFGTDKGRLLKDFKAKLKRLILKTGSYIKPEIAAANKLILEFKAVSVHVGDVIDLMLYKVELCVEFIDNWGIEYSGVMNTISSTYPEILNMIYEAHLENAFSKRCRKVEAEAGYYGLITESLQTEEDETIDS